VYLSEPGIVFVHVPKCAGTSIERFLIEHYDLEGVSREELLIRKNRNPFKGPPSLGHLRARDYVGKGHLRAEQWNRAFKFAFVRHPLRRLVSIYNYRGVSWRARLAGVRDWSFRDFVLRFFPRPFDQNYLRGHDNYSHTRPMWTMLYDRNGEECLVDFVGRLESLHQDFAEVCRRIGIEDPPGLPEANRSLGRDPLSGRRLEAGETAPAWQEYFDPETLRFAREYYRKDFELLGYDPDLPGR